MVLLVDSETELEAPVSIGLVLVESRACLLHVLGANPLCADEQQGWLQVNQSALIKGFLCARHWGYKGRPALAVMVPCLASRMFGMELTIQRGAACHGEWPAPWSPKGPASYRQLCVILLESHAASYCHKGAANAHTL